MRKMVQLMWFMLAAVSAFSGLAQAQEQAYPNKPIRLFVTAAAGGIIDIMARVMQEPLTRGLGQPIIIENKPGAGGNIAVDYVAKSAPDGYTLVIANAGNAAVAPWISKNLPYDPLKDLVGVAVVAEVPLLVAVTNDFPVKTIKELIEYAKKYPGKINYGSAGNGTGPHLSTELFAYLTGIKLTHVPYKGMGPAGIDLAAGRIQMGLLGIGSAKGAIAKGQVRVLAVAGNRRLTALPDVPTYEQAGVSGYDVTNWFGVLAPKGTPNEIVQLLNTQIGKATDEPMVVKRLADVGTLTMKESVAQFQKRIVDDHRKWGEIIRHVGIKAN